MTSYRKPLSSVTGNPVVRKVVRVVVVANGVRPVIVVCPICGFSQSYKVGKNSEGTTIQCPGEVPEFYLKGDSWAHQSILCAKHKKGEL